MKKWITVIVSAIIVAVSVPGLFKITVNMDYTEMMGERTPYVKRLMEITRAKLGSQYSYEVLIEYPEADAIKNNLLENAKEYVKMIFKASEDELNISKQFRIITTSLKIILEVGVFSTCAILLYYDKTTLTLITCTNFDKATQTVYIAELQSIVEE